MKLKLRSETKIDAKLDMLGICNCGDGGGDGGGAVAAPTQQTVTQTNIPDWARPYAEDVMGKAQALSKAAYVPYSGERIAQFTPMQQQAFVGASGMRPNAQLQQATTQALGASYSPISSQNYFNPVGSYDPGTFGTQSFTQPGSAQQFMNPYMQNVVDVQKREAQRASDIAGTQQQAEAVGRGAFGGSRDAIMRAERERNLATQLGDIQATGSQAAYQQAQQQFNTEQQARMQAQQATEQARQYGYGKALEQAGLGAQYGLSGAQLAEQSRQYGAGLGLQGAQLGMQGAQELFQQGVDINKLQQLYGTQQQQRVQDVLSQQYQDFLNQQNYPYRQLGFLSDVVRGTGQLSSGTSGSAIYQAPPSMTSQLTGLGTAALGLSGLAKASGVLGSKEGGKVSEKKAKATRKAAGLSDLALKKIG